MKLKKIIKENELRDLFSISRGSDVYVDCDIIGNEVKKLILNIHSSDGSGRKYITITSGYDEVKIHTEDKVEVTIYHSRVKSFPQFMFSSSEQSEITTWESNILATFNDRIVFERAESKTDAGCLPTPCSTERQVNISWQ